MTARRDSHRLGLRRPCLEGRKRKSVALTKKNQLSQSQNLVIQFLDGLGQSVHSLGYALQPEERSQKRHTDRNLPPRHVHTLPPPTANVQKLNGHSCILEAQRDT